MQTNTSFNPKQWSHTIDALNALTEQCAIADLLDVHVAAILGDLLHDGYITELLEQYTRGAIDNNDDEKYYDISPYDYYTSRYSQDYDLMNNKIPKFK